MKNFHQLDIKYPHGKDFIFTIFDDTDVATLDYIKPIYDRLTELNMRTTKSVWPIKYNGESDCKGSHTLQNKEYGQYIRNLQEKGFEIAYHGATMETSQRKAVKEAFYIFYRVLGKYPQSYAAHAGNRENLYWGKDRFTFFLFKMLYNIISKEDQNYYQGHVKDSPFFWGDLSLRHLKYVRNFTFNGINLLNKHTPLPYKNKKQPWCKYLFYTCDSDNVESFNHLLNEQNQEKLIQERGVCIVSTHFGKGFNKNGKLHPVTDKLLHLLSQKNGWFVPVSDVLDFLKSCQLKKEINLFDLFKLEFGWFIDSFKRNRKYKKYEKTELPYLNLD